MPYYWPRKLILALRWATGRRGDWFHVLNGDGSITSLKVGSGL